MSELGQQLFLKSRNQYEAAVRWAFVLVLIGVVVHATIFSRAVEVQKELHTKQTALETLLSMHEAADGRPETVASFDTTVTEQKERVDTLTTDWMEDLEVRIAQLNELLKPGYRGRSCVETCIASDRANCAGLTDRWTPDSLPWL